MAAATLRRRLALGSVAIFAAVVLASCVVAFSGSSKTALQQEMRVQSMQQLRAAAQTLMATNPGMTPEEAQQQAQLMEEGSITLDPNSENPSADFYANSESSDIGDNDEVEDAGPGNHLGGWTHPELLDPPSPEEVASFVDPAHNLDAPVLNPVDYARNPGAAFAMTSARKDIKQIQAALAKTHEDAEAAKATYEAEEAKSTKLKSEYALYVQKMQAMMNARNNMAGKHNWSPDMDTAARNSGNLMWSQNAKSPPHENNAVDPNNWKIDTDNMEDPAAEFRKNFYNKQKQEEAFLAKQMGQYRMMQRQQGRQQQEGSPLMQQSGMMYQQPQQQQQPAMRTFDGQQLRMLDAPEENMMAEREGLTSRNNQIAKEASMLRQQREQERLQKDTARLELARARLARASRRQSVFSGQGFTEGCPEGTPGCAMRARYARGRREMAPLRHEVREERLMARLGDNMVPVDEARNQAPKFLGDALYQ